MLKDMARAAEAKGSYALVNGLDLYYEVLGKGEPLILLHGGVGASEMFGPNLAALAATHMVIAVHLQAHGHSSDLEGRPLRFESMADDIAVLVKQLGLKQVDLLGYSLGGGVTLQTAIRHPHIVRKLVLVSTPFKWEGWYPDVRENMAQMGPDAAKYMPESPLARLYPKANWVSLFTKLGDLLRQEYDWSKGVAAIQSPMLITFADADSVRLAHIQEFFDLLGGGQRDAGLDGSTRPASQLAILPGVTHYNISTSPLLAAIVPPFLNARLQAPGKT
jgi:pimeloyl-ACP methyl ester carboxylesterase